MDDESVPSDPEMAYLSRREAQERASADLSVDKAARRAHAELADRYARRLRVAMGMSQA